MATIRNVDMIRSSKWHWIGWGLCHDHAVVVVAVVGLPDSYEIIYSFLSAKNSYIIINETIVSDSLR